MKVCSLGITGLLICTEVCLEATLETLRARQKLQVEELKRATAFYSTKELVDRFDTPSRGSPSVVEVVAISLLPRRLLS